MRAFIVTALQARKLPRWGLLLLCLLYVAPGFIGRDPWRTADATGFGVALTMIKGTAADWLMPNIFGAAIFDTGPLPYALAAIAALLAEQFNSILVYAGLDFQISSHLAVRMAAATGLTGMLALFWHATYQLARRPGVLPHDPLGAGASVTDFARSTADSALLIVLATFGLLARMHETTADAAQVSLVAAFLYGLACSLDAPRKGSFIAGLSIAASVATSGIWTAAAMLFAWLLIPLVSQPFRLVRDSSYKIGAPLALIGGALWPIGLLIYGSDDSLAHFAGWLQANLNAIDLIAGKNIIFAGRYMPWFFWPAWPLALWALLRWRGSRDQPIVAVPMLLGAVQLLLVFFARAPSEAWLLTATLPVALLASTALPTLSRTVVNLIDWFAVMLFSLFGIAIWMYWLAYLTGWPPRMAHSANQLVPGFLASWSPFDLTLAIGASAAWLLLVQWRIARRPPVLWRAVVLSSGGLCLAWFLLMTLWLPVFNERNTYRGVADELVHLLPNDARCLQTRQLGLAERGSLAYFANLKYANGATSCPYLLIQDYGRQANLAPANEPGWRLIWQGRRRSNADERFRLYSLIKQ